MSESKETVQDLPLVSVVIPAYNHESYVEQSIRSVLEQTYPRVELVVVDDGSTDGTWDRIEAIRCATGDAFRAFKKSNGGVSSALNYGIERTKGDYIALVASDDYFLPEKIELQMHEAQKVDDDVALIHTNAYNDFGDGNLIDMSGLYAPAHGECFVELLLHQVRLVAPSVLFRRKAYDAIGGFDETLAAEDVDFYTRLAEHGFKMHYLPQPLVVKRATGRNLGLNVKGNYAAHVATLKKYQGRIAPSLYRRAEVNLLLSKGRHAAAGGDLRLSFDAYREAASIAQSLAPMLEWVRCSMRSIVLRSIPFRARGALRRARYFIGQYNKKSYTL